MLPKTTSQKIPPARMLEIRIDKLWQRYLVAEEKEKQRLKEQNDRLLTFQSNMWAAMADTLIEDYCRKKGIEGVKPDAMSKEELIKEKEI